MSRPLTRRAFIAGSVAAVAAACSSGDGSGNGQAAPAPTATPTPPPSPTPTPTPSPTPTAVPLPGPPFTLGVASGDPLPDSVVLWTRLAPEGGGMPDSEVEVAWELAREAGFGDVVAAGTAVATPALGHSVHVDATGLEPETPYWYRFHAGDFTSPVGRTRTFPAASSSPDQFRLLFSSCQNYEEGFYGAWRNALDEDVHAVLFLGDYIYEGAGGGGDVVRSHTGGEPATLAEYRDRYALYKRDPDLAAAHAAFPWIITWDDHEVDNDYAGAVSQDEDPEESFLERRAQAYQAWYEHLPVRLPPPTGPDYPIFRAVSFGDLAQMYVLDTRQYRSNQPCDAGRLSIPGLGDNLPLSEVCDQALDPAQTILGPEQKAWLNDGLAASEAQWNLLAQQVLMANVASLPGFGDALALTDTWGGYQAERAEVLAALAATANPVVLTGDFHSAAVNDLRADADSPVQATELMATSISSSFFEGAAGLAEAALPVNPDIKFFDTRQGYAVVTVTPAEMTAEFRAVEDRTDPATGIETIASFVIESGTPGARQL